MENEIYLYNKIEFQIIARFLFSIIIQYNN